MSKKSLFLLISIFSLFFVSACQQLGKKACCGKKLSWFSKSKSCCPKQSVTGYASVTAVNDGKIKGEVFFEKAGKYKVKVSANITGLKPNQKFGFHVHEFGTCENKALMAGAHFNPRDKKHGGPEDKERHFGDLGNLSSDDKGQAAYSVVVKGKVKKFLGRSVIVHALPDDLKSQPTGNAGDRIACGVIVASMPRIVAKPEIDKKALLKVLKVNQPKFIQCYKSALAEKPSIQGKLGIKWFISPNGKGQQARATSDSMRNKSLANCVAGVLEGLNFPPSGLTFTFHFYHPNKLKKTVDKKPETSPQAVTKSKNIKIDTTPTVTADKNTIQKDSSSPSVEKPQTATQKVSQQTTTKQAATPAVKNTATSPATQKVSDTANKTKTEEVKQ